MRIIRTAFTLTALAAAVLLTGCGTSDLGDILGGSRDPGTYRSGDVQGSVERVNTRDRYIVVDPEGTEYRYNLRNGDSNGEVVLYYDDRTTVEHQGQTYRPEDLEVGDRILASVDQSGDRLFVQDIEVLRDVTTGGVRDGVGASELRGTVGYVDTRGRTLEITPSSYGSGFSSGRSGEVVVVHYDDQTTVEFEGRRYSPENLERGDVVEVELRDLGSQLLAREILVVGEGGSVTR